MSGGDAIGQGRKALVQKRARQVAAFGDCFHTTECREGMTAFLEKRPASWMEDNSV